MSKTVLSIIAIVIVIGAIILLTNKKSPAPTDMPTDSTTTGQTPSPAASVTKPIKKPSAQTTPTTPAPTTDEPTTPDTTPSDDTDTDAPAPQVIVTSVHASDTTADLKVIEANKGDTVKLTFIADPRNNYHGGLEFRSTTMDPVKVMTGQSIMVSFVADETFSFTPYWPGTETKMPYTIDIIVK
jgi:hypothetical protein